MIVQPVFTLKAEGKKGFKKEFRSQEPEFRIQILF
jgi:hypothetical protein